MLKEKVFCKQLKGRQRFLRLIGDSKKLRGLRSGYVILKPKESIGEQNTGSCEEVITVINGSGLVAYGNKSSIKIKKGAFIYIGPQMPHNVINTSKVLLKYIYTAAQV